MYTCKFCGKQCKNINSYKNHERLCPCNPDRKLPVYDTSKCGWNRGLTKNTDSRLKQSAEAISKFYRAHPEKCWTQGNPMYDEKHKITHSESMKKVGKQFKGRAHPHTKAGWYKDIWCDSSWELAWVIYCIDHSIPFIRNSKGFDYVFNNENHTYFPDFYLIEKDTYVEIKGYCTEKDLAKFKYFPNSIEVIDDQKIQPILEYVVSTYGNNYTDMYD